MNPTLHVRSVLCPAVTVIGVAWIDVDTNYFCFWGIAVADNGGVRLLDII